jgi:hypothetical protein
MFLNKTQRQRIWLGGAVVGFIVAGGVGYLIVLIDLVK